MITPETQAHSQIMGKTLAQFQNDLCRTVRDVAHTRYLPLSGGGTTEPRKAEYCVYSLFLEMAGDKRKMFAFVNFKC